MSKLCTLLILIFLINFTFGKRRVRNVSRREEQELENQHRNAICCAKNMRCCVKPNPPEIEIRAIAARCPNFKGETESTITRNIDKPVVPVNEQSIRSFQGFDEDEPLMQSHVTNCRRKVLLTLKMQHKGPIKYKNQYVVVDHVFDPVSRKSVRLLNPYVIKLRQDNVAKGFHLRFVDYANSEAHEQVYNKHDNNYTGCYTDKTRSTCGIVKYDGKVIPYSEGFCCSCDAKKNADRQPDSVNNKNEAIVSFSDPAYLLDRVQCPRNFYKEQADDESLGKRTISDEEVKESTTSSSPIFNEFMSPYTTQNSTNLETTPTSTIKITRWQYSTYISKAHSTTENAHKYLMSETTNSKNKRQDTDTAPNSDPLLDSITKESEEYLKQLNLNQRKQNPNEYIEAVKKSHIPQKQEQYRNYLDGDSILRLRKSIPNLDLADYIYDLDIDDDRKRALLRKIRQTFPSGVQKRGGQNCANRFTPAGLDPEHYHESTHCLRFSDVWYGIYKLGHPNIDHTIYVNIFERFETETNPEKWREITNGTIVLNNMRPLYMDEMPTISIQLTSKTLSDPTKFVKLNKKRILIPEGIKHCDMYKYPEMRNGPEEYLVVSPDKIAIEGDQCDKIGVGFEAFYKQPNRCGMQRSTCLHNQPKQLWKQDKIRERKNKKGCYFLKYHANISAHSLVINESSGDKVLMLEYNGLHQSTLDIEIKADFNAILKDLTNVVISEVYVESTCDKITILTVKVINTGLVSNKFMVALTDFPLEIADQFANIKSIYVLIPPQNQHIFTLQIRAKIPTELLYCTVEVLNSHRELVALRRLRMQRNDRCICTWHCLCACVASSTGLKCIPMSLEHYHAAGFQGALPTITYMVHFTLLDDLLSIVFYFSLFLLAVLIIMSLFKAVIGLCCPGIGIWGLPVILDLPKRLKQYYEPELRKYRVIYDAEGWPVHPKTNQRVRDISRATQFCSNSVFFFTYPLACCMIIFRRLCCPYYTKKKVYKQPENKDYKDNKGGRKQQTQDKNIQHKTRVAKKSSQTEKTKQKKTKKDNDKQQQQPRQAYSPSSSKTSLDKNSENSPSTDVEEEQYSEFKEPPPPPPPPKQEPPNKRRQQSKFKGRKKDVENSSKSSGSVKTKKKKFSCIAAYTLPSNKPEFLFMGDYASPKTKASQMIKSPSRASGRTFRGASDSTVEESTEVQKVPITKPSTTEKTITDKERRMKRRDSIQKRSLAALTFKEKQKRNERSSVSLYKRPSIKKRLPSPESTASKTTESSQESESSSLKSDTSKKSVSRSHSSSKTWLSENTTEQTMSNKPSHAGYATGRASLIPKTYVTASISQRMRPKSL